jgi:hypothetical protein
MSKRRWIGYLQQNIPGNQSFQMYFYDTLESAKLAFKAFCADVGSTDCSMTLYYAGNDQSMYDLAREYEDIGCPFDCADKYIECGPRGGIKLCNN